MTNITTPVNIRYYRIYRQWYLDNPGTYTGIDNTDVQGVYRSNVISGSANPNWRYQVAKRQDASTPYTRDWLEFTQPVLSAEGVYPAGSRFIGSRVRTSYVPYSPKLFAAYTDPSVDDQALKRLKNKLANRLGNARLLAPLAELRELHKSIRAATNLSTGLMLSLLEIQRTKKGKEALNFASAAWLEYSFGIKPLVGDVQNAMASVDAYLNRRHANIRVVGTSKRRNFVNYKDGCTNPGLYAGHVCFSWSMTRDYSCRYVAGISNAFQCANDYGIGEHLGFTWQELIPTFWELVPYSWVVDYFSTVGDYLSDTFVLPEGSTIYVTKTVRNLLSGQALAAIRDEGLKYCTSVHVKPGSVKYVRVDRTKFATLPHAALRVKSIDEVGINAVNRLLNLASVLIQRRIH